MSGNLTDLPLVYETERCLIRRLEPGDGSILHEAILDCDFLLSPGGWYKRYTGFDELSVENTEKLVLKWHQAFNERTEFRLIIILKENLKCLGQVSVHNVDWSAGEGEYGACIRESAQHQGYIKEIVNTLKSFGFEYLGLKRIIALTSQDAHVSIKLAEKFGFQLEASGDWILKWGDEKNLNGRRYVLTLEDCKLKK